MIREAAASAEDSNARNDSGADSKTNARDDSGAFESAPPLARTSGRGGASRAARARSLRVLRGAGRELLHALRRVRVRARAGRAGALDGLLPSAPLGLGARRAFPRRPSLGGRPSLLP